MKEPNEKLPSQPNLMVRVWPSVLETFKEKARREGRTYSWVLRRAVLEYLERPPIED